MSPKPITYQLVNSFLDLNYESTSPMLTTANFCGILFFYVSLVFPDCHDQKQERLSEIFDYPFSCEEE